MAEDIQRAHDDISYIKSLVRDDKGALFAAGMGMETCGLVFGVSTLRYIASGLGWDLPSALTALMPFDAIAVFFGLLVVRMHFAVQRAPSLKRRQGGPAVSALSRAVVAAWQAMGVGYLVVLIALAGLGVTQGNISAMVAFVLWGGGWLVTFGAYKRRWQIAVVIGCYAMALALGFVVGAYAALIAAAGLFLLVALPGHLILTEARTAICEQGERHV